MSRRLRRRRESFREIVFMGALFAVLGVLVAVVTPCVGSDRPARDREHRANCVEAERSLGDSVYQERPDCRGVLDR